MLFAAHFVFALSSYRRINRCLHFHEIVVIDSLPSLRVKMFQRFNIKTIVGNWNLPLKMTANTISRMATMCETSILENTNQTTSCESRELSFPGLKVKSVTIWIWQLLHSIWFNLLRPTMLFQKWRVYWFVSLHLVGCLDTEHLVSTE